MCPSCVCSVLAPIPGENECALQERLVAAERDAVCSRQEIQFAAEIASTRAHLRTCHTLLLLLSVSLLFCVFIMSRQVEEAQIWESLIASNFGPEDYQVTQPTIPAE